MSSSRSLKTHPDTDGNGDGPFYMPTSYGANQINNVLTDPTINQSQLTFTDPANILPDLKAGYYGVIEPTNVSIDANVSCQFATDQLVTQNQPVGSSLFRTNAYNPGQTMTQTFVSRFTTQSGLAGDTTIEGNADVTYNWSDPELDPLDGFKMTGAAWNPDSASNNMISCVFDTSGAGVLIYTYGPKWLFNANFDLYTDPDINQNFAIQSPLLPADYSFPVIAGSKYNYPFNPSVKENRYSNRGDDQYAVLYRKNFLKNNSTACVMNKKGNLFVAYGSDNPTALGGSGVWYYTFDQSEEVINQHYKSLSTYAEKDAFLNRITESTDPVIDPSQDDANINSLSLYTDSNGNEYLFALDIVNNIIYKSDLNSSGEAQTPSTWLSLSDPVSGTYYGITHNPAFDSNSNDTYKKSLLYISVTGDVSNAGTNTFGLIPGVTDASGNGYVLGLTATSGLDNDGSFNILGNASNNNLFRPGYMCSDDLGNLTIMVDNNTDSGGYVDSNYSNQGRSMNLGGVPRVPGNMYRLLAPEGANNYSKNPDSNGNSQQLSHYTSSLYYSQFEGAGNAETSDLSYRKNGGFMIPGQPVWISTHPSTYLIPYSTYTGLTPLTEAEENAGFDLQIAGLNTFIEQVKRDVSREVTYAYNILNKPTGLTDASSNAFDNELTLFFADLDAFLTNQDETIMTSANALVHATNLIVTYGWVPDNVFPQQNDSTNKFILDISFNFANKQVTYQVTNETFEPNRVTTGAVDYSSQTDVWIYLSLLNGQNEVYGETGNLDTQDNFWPGSVWFHMNNAYTTARDNALTNFQIQQSALFWQNNENYGTITDTFYQNLLASLRDSHPNFDMATKTNEIFTQYAVYLPLKVADEQVENEDDPVVYIQATIDASNALNALIKEAVLVIEASATDFPSEPSSTGPFSNEVILNDDGTILSDSPVGFAIIDDRSMIQASSINNEELSTSITKEFTNPFTGDVSNETFNPALVLETNTLRSMITAVYNAYKYTPPTFTQAQNAFDAKMTELVNALGSEPTMEQIQALADNEDLYNLWVAWKEAANRGSEAFPPGDGYTSDSTNLRGLLREYLGKFGANIGALTTTNYQANNGQWVAAFEAEGGSFGNNLAIFDGNFDSFYVSTTAQVTGPDGNKTYRWPISTGGDSIPDLGAEPVATTAQYYTIYNNDGTTLISGGPSGVYGRYPQEGDRLFIGSQYSNIPQNSSSGNITSGFLYMQLNTPPPAGPGPGGPPPYAPELLSITGTLPANNVLPQYVNNLNRIVGVGCHLDFCTPFVFDLSYGFLGTDTNNVAIPVLNNPVINGNLRHPDNDETETITPTLQKYRTIATNQLVDDSYTLAVTKFSTEGLSTSSFEVEVTCIGEDAIIDCQGVISESGETTIVGVRVQDLQIGDMVRTYSHGFKKVTYIDVTDLRDTLYPNKLHSLYRLTQDKYPELTDDLYLTGGHSLLMDSLTSEQEMEMKKISWPEDFYKVDGKHKLLVHHDKRSIKVGKKMRVFNIVLEQDDEKDSFKTYGIYANGLLVESCNKGSLDFAFKKSVFISTPLLEEADNKLIKV